MKLHILSDLHIEFGAFDPPDVQADVVVLTGDVHVGVAGVRWALDKLGGQRVIYVAGNHEFYRKALPEHIQTLKGLTAGTHIHFLENEAVTIDGVVFVGCTLWSDFRLLGNQAAAKAEAQTGMTDYRLIRVSPSYRMLLPADTERRHTESVAWLAEELKKHRVERVVIVTHHAPSAKSLSGPPDLLSAAFASNLDELVQASGARLWIHGHTHHNVDYVIGDTRLLANQRGYYAVEPNAQFVPDLVVDI